MFDWLARSGSLKPSRTWPSPLAWASVAAVTLAAPQIIGTKLDAGRRGDAVRAPRPVVVPGRAGLGERLLHAGEVPGADALALAGHGHRGGGRGGGFDGGRRRRAPGSRRWPMRVTSGAGAGDERRARRRRGDAQRGGQPPRARGDRERPARRAGTHRERHRDQLGRTDGGGLATAAARAGRALAAGRAGPRPTAAGRVRPAVAVPPVARRPAPPVRLPAGRRGRRASRPARPAGTASSGSPPSSRSAGIISPAPARHHGQSLTCRASRLRQSGLGAPSQPGRDRGQARAPRAAGAARAPPCGT